MFNPIILEIMPTTTLLIIESSSIRSVLELTNPEVLHIRHVFS
jgi:hypothetical protein